MSAVSPDRFVVFHGQTHRRDLFGLAPASEELGLSVGAEMFNFVDDAVSIFVNAIQVGAGDLFTVAGEVYIHVGDVVWVAIAQSCRIVRRTNVDLWRARRVDLSRLCLVRGLI